VKRLLCEDAEPLGVINWNFPFIIGTDASDHTVAGDLAQRHDHGKGQ
jgi:hypothetical protein